MSGLLNTQGQNRALPNDWNNNPFWDDTTEGQSVNYGNGAITRGAANTATYRAAGDTGPGYTFNRQQSPESVAAGSPDIAAVWQNQYGERDHTVDATAVSGAGSVAGASASGYGVANYGEQTKLDVTPDQTVAEQVKKLIAENSPLQQQAETRALQQVNSRGLLNSSIAVGAGQEALYDRALPIAGADASTYANAARYNADVSNQRTSDQFGATNQASAFAANAQNQASQFNAESRNRQLSQDFEAQNQARNINAASANQLILSNLDRGNRIQLSNIEADYRSLIQVSSSASDIYRQTLSAIGNAVSDPNTDADAKTAIINGYTGYLQNSLNLIGSINGVDLTGLLDFGTVAGA